MIYLAAPVAGAIEARTVAAHLRSSGIGVSSTWHDHTAPDERDPWNDDVRRPMAERCAWEVRTARRLVVLGHVGKLSAPPKGTFVEAGIALGLGKLVAWFHDGDRGRCVFDAMAWRRVDVSLRPGVKLEELVLDAVAR